MRIGEIKQLTGSYKIKHIVGWFWDATLESDNGEQRAIYYNAMVKKQYKSIEEVYEEIRGIVISILPELPKSHRRYMDDFAEQLYGDRHKWKNGTVIAEKREQLAKRREERREAYNKLIFLYDVYNLNQLNNKKDLVKHISRDQDISNKIIDSSSNLVNNHELLYNICLPFIKEEVLNGYLEYKRYYIINGVSRIVYKDSDYWLNDLGITRDAAIKLTGREVFARDDSKDEIQSE